MKIANLVKWKKTLEDNYPIIIDHFTYDIEKKEYECEWVENKKYMEINGLEVGEAGWGCVGKSIKDIVTFLDESYYKEDLHLY